MSDTEYAFTKSLHRFTLLGDGHIPAVLFSGGNPPVLFDPGVSAFGPLYLRTMRTLMDETPRALTVLLTHSHFDHSGAVPYLKRCLDRCTVAAGKRAAEVLQKPKAIAFIQKLNAEYEEQMADSLQGEDTTFDGIRVDRILSDGETMQLGSGSSCMVLETPGHTRDCLSFFFPECGMLVAGEAGGVPQDDFIHSVFLSDYTAYMHSIRRLQAVKADALCIAHVGILKGQRAVQSYLADSLAAAARYRTMLEERIKQFDGDVDRIVDDITAKEYDSRSVHIVNRTPFMTNLRAKVQCVMRLDQQ